MATIARRARQTGTRSVVKTALYRVLMFLVTGAVAFVMTGDLGTALDIGIATNLIKTLTYYGYERLWARIEWETAVVN
ncbi:hypothetical protein BRC86_02800 [Halobacteriales archaeon QS_3_64_16]|nr:MAG: hypothetical protein BRC86_02800 [Halobacteriales archaeon QS_3_64_16]